MLIHAKRASRFRLDDPHLLECPDPVLTHSRKMTFWGVIVQPDEPYTLQLGGDQKRLRISQATLGESRSGLWRSRSSLRCAVGSKPPVFICSLSNEMPCCRLDLEFEETEDVVFSIKGPRGIHLSGYYITPCYAERDPTSCTGNLRTLSCNCNGGDVSNVDNDEQKKLTVEEEDIGKTDSLNVGAETNLMGTEGGNDVFTDASDHLVNDNLQVLNASADENMKKNINLQEIPCGSGSFPERKDEYECCARKSDKTAISMIEENEKGADSMTSQLNNALDTGTEGIGLKDRADSANRPSEHERVIEVPLLLPPKHEVNSKVGQKLKKIIKNEVLNDLHQRRKDGKPINDKFSNGVSKEIGCPNNLIQSSDVSNENNKKCKKRKKGKVSKRNSIDKDAASFDNVLEKMEQRIAINGDMLQVLSKNSEEKKPICDNYWNGEEEINNAENDKERNLTIEEEDIGKTDSLAVGGEDNSEATYAGNDVSIDAVDHLVNVVLQELNANIANENVENNINQQEITYNRGSFLEMKDEHVSCARKSDKTTMSMIEKDGKDVNKMTSGQNSTSVTGTDGIGSEDKADSANRLSEHERVIGIPPPMLPQHAVKSKVGQKSKKRRKNDDSKDLHQRRKDANLINDKFSNGLSRERACPNSNNLIQSCDISNENNQTSKKRKKNKVSQRKYLDKEAASSDNAREKMEQRIAISGDVLQVLPKSTEEKEAACDKSNDIHSHKKKKKRKITGEENGQNLSTKSSQMRTLSKDLIFEELAADKGDEKVAASGKKVSTKRGD